MRSTHTFSTSSSGRGQERPQFGRRFFRHLLCDEVAAAESLAFRLHSFLFPEVNGIAKRRRTIASFGPQGQNRTRNFVVPIGRGETQTEAGPRAVDLEGG